MIEDEININNPTDFDIKIVDNNSPWMFFMLGIIVIGGLLAFIQEDLLIAFVAILFILGGINGLVGFFLEWREGAQSKSWPSVEGEIIASEILALKSQAIVQSINFIKGIVYKYQINGEEFVSNRVRVELVGEGSTSRGTENRTSVGIGDADVPVQLDRERDITPNLSEHSEDDLSKYDVGDSVMVYYKKNNPEFSANPIRKIFTTGHIGPGGKIAEDYVDGKKIGNAVLEPGFDLSKNYMTLVLGLGLLIVGSLLFGLYLYGFDRLLNLISV